MNIAFFRNEPEYKARLKRLTDAIDYYYADRNGPCGGLESLMLAAFSLSKLIKANHPVVPPNYKSISIYQALQAVKIAIDNDRDIKPLQFESHQLDIFSRLAYEMLKKENKLSQKPKQLTWADNQPY
jgi:hypothetical protein